MYIVRPHRPQAADITVNLPESEAPPWSVGATYQINDRVVHGHEVYISTIAGNTGIDPSGENQDSPATTRWLRERATNAFAMFDGVLSNPSAGDQITATVDHIGDVDTLILFGLAGQVATVTGYDVAGNQIQSWSEALAGREVNDWWQFFKEPFRDYADKMLVTSIPSTVRRLTIQVAGDPAQIGEVVMGESVRIGTIVADGTGGDGIGHSRLEYSDQGIARAVKRPSRIEMRYRVHEVMGRMNIIKPWLDRSAGDLVAAYAKSSRPLTFAYGFLQPIAWDEPPHETYFFDVKLKGVI